MSLRQKKYTVFAVMLGVPVLLGVVVFALPAGPNMERFMDEVWCAAFFLAVVAGFGLHLFWMCCPHCGRHLDRNYGQYCQHCGEKIDWDEKPGRKGDQS